MSTCTWAARRWVAMGSTAELLVWAPNPEVLADHAVAAVERLEAEWSRFRTSSALVALNRRAGTGPQRVSGALATALRRAHEAFLLTDGRFDPTVLGALCALGYDRTFAEVSRRPDLHTDLSGVGVAPFGFDAVEMVDDHDSLFVTIPNGITLDLGGIGKGLASDLVVDELAMRGAVSICLSLGGDIRVSGPGPDADGAWPIPVEDPRTTRVAFEFQLLDEAIAQSTTLIRRWQCANGRDAHHVIDPSTGRPSEHAVAAVVCATNAWEADVLAKAALVADRTAALALVTRAGGDLWLFEADGSLHTTPAVVDTIETTVPCRS